MEGTTVASFQDVNQKVKPQATLIPRASVSETTFRIMVIYSSTINHAYAQSPTDFVLTDHWTRRCNTNDSQADEENYF